MLASLIGVLTGWYLKKHIRKRQYHEEYLSLEQERDELNKRMSQAEEAMDRRYYLMTSENQKAHNELNKSQSDNVILSKKIQSLSTELENAKITSHSLQEELAATHKEVSELQGMNEQLWTEKNLSKPQAQATGLKKQSQNIEKANAKETLINAQTDTDLESLQHKISLLNTENSHLKKRIEEYTQKKLDLTNITSQLDRANSERERLLDSQAFGDEKSKLIEELKIDLSSTQAILSDKETELARYKSYLIDEEKKLVAEVESSTAKLFSSEQQSAKLQTKYAESMKTIEALEAEVSRLTDSNQELQRQLASNEKEHATLKQDHNKQRYQIEQLSSQVRKLTANPENK